jgi:hypothetical protein
LDKLLICVRVSSKLSRSALEKSLKLGVEGVNVTGVAIVSGSVGPRELIRAG